MSPGDIYWVELPATSGHEQTGRRPAIILQDESVGGGLPLVIVIPLTTAMTTTRFAGTLVVMENEENHLSKPSVALVFQIRAIDRRALRDQIGRISAHQLSEIHTLLDQLVGRTAQ